MTIRGPILLYDLFIDFPVENGWVERKLLRAGHRRKGSTRSERRENMPLVDRVAIIAEVYEVLGGLPAALKTFKHDSRHESSVVTKHIDKYVLWYCTLL